MAEKPKHKQYCNKFNKDFKNGPHQKKKKKKERNLKEKNDTIQIEFCVNSCDGHQSYS